MHAQNDQFNANLSRLIFSWWNPLIAAVATIWLDLDIDACRGFFELLSIFLPNGFLGGVFKSEVATAIFVAIVTLLFAPFIRLAYIAVDKSIQHQIIKKRQQEKLISDTAEQVEKAMNLSIQCRHECKNLAAIVNHLEMSVAQLSEQVEAFKNHAYGDILQGG